MGTQISQYDAPPMSRLYQQHDISSSSTAAVASTGLLILISIELEVMLEVHSGAANSPSRQKGRKVHLKYIEYRSVDKLVNH